jgi:two-component system LytT family response regulator
MTACRVLIVDDEPLARVSVRTLLSREPDIAIVGECADGVSAVDAIRGEQPDLVFLDVQMPGLDGFGVIREVGPDRMPITIFVTAYDTFAVRAFETRALDYLVKPFSDERFAATLARAREHRRSTDAARLGQLLVDRVASGAYTTHLLVPAGTRTMVVPVDSIDWIGADDYYAVLHVGPRTHLLRQTLTALAAELDPRAFVRVHRSAIVNLRFIRALEKSRDGSTALVLADGVTVPVSRTGRERLDAAFGQ